MLDGPSVVAALRSCGVTHVVWIPDSCLGRWESALLGATDLTLIRVCREGEAFGVAAGLLLGGKRPIVLIQCTGFFEAGDAVRNVVHDLHLPVFAVVGVRSHQAHQQGRSDDSCAVFSEPIVRAWQISYTWLYESSSGDDLAAAYRQAWAEQRPGIVLLSE
jgi:sulfopyruvate decarboxylase TPP-binding subunit